jgi:hypothetical protein
MRMGRRAPVARNAAPCGTLMGDSDPESSKRLKWTLRAWYEIQRLLFELYEYIKTEPVNS